MQWQSLVPGADALRTPGATPPAASGVDLRTYALNAASVALLKRLRVWEALPDAARCPVRNMLIEGDAGGRLEFSAWEQGLDVLAWIVDAGALEAALRQAVRFNPHITAIDARLQPRLESVSAETLWVVCEGKDAASREALNIPFERHPYGHTAVAARVVADRPHAGVASQWFAPEGGGVLALLPFDDPVPGHSYGVVWSVPQARATELLALSDAPWCDALAAASATACGAFTVQGARAAWPLALGRATAIAGTGWVVLGDSAHTVHPLAGQGLNLGLADVEVLAQVVAERESWRPVGDARVLARYARRRAEPLAAMAAVTDGLWQLFTHPSPWLRPWRNQGMSMLNHWKGLKRSLTRQALGLSVAAALTGLSTGALLGTDTAWAQAPALAVEAALRKVLAERMPSMPKPDEISRAPVPGLWELRFGSEIVYADEKGEYLISGSILETKTQRDLTAERLDKLNAIQFAALPLKDAIVIKQGAGTRKLVVFSDPNCGYCKRYERELLNAKDVTLYTFLYPVLGKDSVDKSKAIWCSADPAKAWRDWMVDGRQPAAPTGKCDDAALTRNTALGQRHRIDSTPTSVLEDGTRRNGAMPLTDLERLFAAAKSPKS